MSLIKTQRASGILIYNPDTFDNYNQAITNCMIDFNSFICCCTFTPLYLVRGVERKKNEHILYQIMYAPVPIKDPVIQLLSLDRVWNMCFSFIVLEFVSYELFRIFSCQALILLKTTIDVTCLTLCQIKKKDLPLFQNKFQNTSNI